MTLKTRTALRWGLAAVVLGWLAWSHFHHDGAAIAAPARPAAQSQATPRTWKLGALTLTACELPGQTSGSARPHGARCFRYRKTVPIRTAASSG